MSFLAILIAVWCGVAVLIVVAAAWVRWRYVQLEAAEAELATLRAENAKLAQALKLAFDCIDDMSEGEFADSLRAALEGKGT